jgi:small subunit ribosomal protein S5
VAELLETPPAANAITKLNPEEIDRFEELWVQFDQEKSEVWLHKIVDFFAARGVNFVPPQNYKETTLRKTPAANGSHHSSLHGTRLRSNILDPTYSPVSRQEDGNFPDLMMSDSILDPRDVLDLPPSAESPFHNRVTVRNHRSVFHNYGDEPLDNAPDSEREGEMNEETNEEMEVGLSKKAIFPGKADSAEAENVNIDEFTKALPVAKRFYTGLHQSILMRRSVVQQTGKGKIRRISYMVLVGNGDGLVGYGEGKHSNSIVALTAARLAAVRNMDWVERFEKRTVWTEMKTKLGATQLIIRPRPVGFGLRCNPFLHQILRAAGFKDISAKVWGSRNRLNVIKAAFRMIHAGHAPTGMGDGMGGPGKKLNRGRGLRNMSELERARGRKLISLRK